MTRYLGVSLIVLGVITLASSLIKACLDTFLESTLCVTSASAKWDTFGQSSEKA